MPADALPGGVAPVRAGIFSPAPAGAVTEKRRRRLLISGLLTPATLLFVTVYFGGIATLVATSLELASRVGPSAAPGFGAYAEALSGPTIATTVWRTVGVSSAAVVACLLLGFPVSRYLASSSGRLRGLVVMCVLSPLMVTAIGRTFGWVALLGPGGLIGNFVHALGGPATGLLYTEVAMVIGLTNMLLPFMVLAVLAARVAVDDDLLKAAASLGASPFSVFYQIELPLCAPGILSGILIVFSLSVSNFVTAVLLGGSGRNVVAYEIFLDSLIYFEPARGAALAVMLLLVTTALMATALMVGSRRSAARQEGRSH
jgi:putative spermidine/putrescine transport system permease protein